MIPPHLLTIADDRCQAWPRWLPRPSNQTCLDDVQRYGRCRCGRLQDPHRITQCAEQQTGGGS